MRKRRCREEKGEMSERRGSWSERVGDDCIKGRRRRRRYREEEDRLRR